MVVISNMPDAFALERARKHRIDAFSFPHQGVTREQHEADVIACLEQHKVDLVCLAGYLRMLTPVFINKYAGRLMNTHPALLPSFGGKGMHGLKVHQAVLDYGCKVSGCTVHFVSTDVDGGPIILQESVPVLENDTPTTLANRIHPVEHRLYTKAVALYAARKLKIEGRIVRILE